VKAKLKGVAQRCIRTTLIFVLENQTDIPHTTVIFD